MNARTALTVAVVALLVTAGVGVTSVAAADAIAADETTGEELAFDASYDNGTVTVTVTNNGTAVEGANVSENDTFVGATDGNGTVAFETNATELTITVETPNATLERAYTVENGTLVADDGTELALDAAYDNGTVTVTVTDNGTAVEGANVSENGAFVGETDENGTLTFETNATELTITVETENATLERTYTVEDGELVADEEDDDAGPPVTMPGGVPPHVSSIHELVQSFVDGEHNGSLGESVSDVAGNGSRPPAHAENASDDAGPPEDAGKPDDAGGSDDADEEDDSDSSDAGRPDHAGGNRGA